MAKLVTALVTFGLLIVLLGASTLFMLRSTQPASMVPDAAAAPASPRTDTAAPVVAQGRVVPVRSMQLKFAAKSDNVVAEVLVQAGQQVDQGTLLARLDTRDLELAVQEAQAALAQAQANQDRIEAEATPAGTARTAELAVATAQIQQADAALKRAQLALERATLRAPIAGTVVEVNVQAGEAPSETQPAIVLADLSAWQIETVNLTEQNVVQIQENTPVRVTIDALPGLELSGKITQIKAVGQPLSPDGSATYTAIITLDRQDPRLRWNMRATAAIMPSEQTN
jgi:HlyD family secretion protein